ncbi:hypothetical protein AMTRI_Chr11g99920 [Amborella trichopoda]
MQFFFTLFITFLMNISPHLICMRWKLQLQVSLHMLGFRTHYNLHCLGMWRVLPLNKSNSLLCVPSATWFVCHIILFELFLLEKLQFF